MDSMVENGWDNFYTGEHKIGKGVYGTIYQSVNACAGNVVTVRKTQPNQAYKDGVPSKLLREIMILKFLQHPNIISLEDVIINKDQSHLVFEFVIMNMKTYISRIPSGIWMDRIEQKLCLYQILQGIHYCHQRNILHCDLKLENLLIDCKGCLKLAQFRFSEAVCEEELCINSYKAPELLFGSTCYTSATDIWSIGCIAAEIALKVSLFPTGGSNIDQISCIFSVLSTPCEETLQRFKSMRNCSESFPQWSKNHLYEILNGSLDADGIMIIQKMLNYQPEKRISAEELLKNSYFADFDEALITSEH